jgi:poly-gamma-glutamate synthesis protein (capsule biosynthesis protein)
MHWRARVVTGAAVASVAAALVLTFVITRDDTSAGVGDGGGGVAARPATTATSRPSSSASTSTTNPRGSRNPVTLAFAGDVHFEGELRGKLAADPGSVLGPIAPVLAAADLAVVNLETAITERGEPAPKRYTFRAPASAFTALAAAGVDVASMANNHGLDYGPVGLEDSLTAAALSGFPVIGIGRDAAQAYAPYRTVVDGQRIAVLAATQVLDGNLIEAWTATDTRPGLASAKDVDRLVAAVAEARATSDTVVAFLHWGIERQECPSAAQQELARRLVSAGADVVVGGHAHRVQGAGRLGGALVAYGLGNFAFYAKPGAAASSGVLLVTVTGREVDAYEWRPAVIRGGVPYPLEGEEAASAVARWDGLRGCAGLER